MTYSAHVVAGRLAPDLSYIRTRIMLADLSEFVEDHRPHGSLTADATEPAWNGYLLTVACSCGVVFGRWVTPGGFRTGSASARPV
jgi:hypothetical protein